MSHTINVTDLVDQDAVHRVLSDIQNYGVSYALVQDGIEVAKVVPTEEKVTSTEDYDSKDSEELAKHRREVIERVKVFREKIAHMWNTDENAAELVANNRR